jgi:hypothetical protein
MELARERGEGDLRYSRTKLVRVERAFGSRPRNEVHSAENPAKVEI